MRFLLYDRVLDAVKGRSIVAVKHVALTEDHLAEGYAGRPALAGSLLIESMAQVAGWLVHLSTDFRVSAFLCIVDDAELIAELPPGRSVRIEAHLLSLSKRWAQLRCVAADEEGRTVARVARLNYVLRDIEDPAEIANEENRFRYYSGWPLERIRAVPS
ncbi:hypothetical protein NDR87_14955 [Nocardia sp. CDC159]|uniref:3-hydroxyacyl-[acyl-carrier-protein] dehydratase n=1 Tax=Nocardia pulmonis TaxID=2951408 RepID=A0A9X2E8J2_9NOCA|nr:MULTISPECIES: hypothetical protein [Nocardia]MCM6775611.1 hypothetical protein [Nocardia pulmonis]MCM6787655.1 hypothetical protein [Nocardia sp. CDC159]